MKKIFTVLPVLALVLSVSACQEEPDPGTDIPTGNESLIFTVGGVDKIETKANVHKVKCVQTDRIALSEPGDPDQLFLIETVEDMDNIYYSSNVDTKGTPVYTETFANTHQNFSTVPYQSGAAMTSGFKSPWSGLIQASKNRYSFDFTDGWPGTAPILFFMAAPADLTQASNSTLGYKNLKLDATNGIIEFDYEAPVIKDEETGMASLTGAAGLKDLLFTCKTVTKDEYKGNGATILFYHTLAGVKFKSGNAVREGTKTEGSDDDQKTVAKLTNINSIKFTNIRTTGHCTLTPDQNYSNNNSNANGPSTAGATAPEGSVPKSCLAAQWELTNDVASFTINPNGVVSNDGQFPTSTDFEGASVSGNTDKELGQNNLNSSNFDQTFMFVPQETGTEGDCILTIEYTLRGKKYKKAVNFGKRTWQAGKLYTYTLTANHVGVSIEDEVVDSKTQKKAVKQNVVITSTGNVDEYMRIAIVGNWYDSHSVSTSGEDQIVWPWSGVDNTATNNEGYFTGWNTAWVSGGDGFYYYKYAVSPGQCPPAPFESFTAGTCPFNLYGSSAHLELDIIVQAIDASWKDGASKEAKMKSYGWNMDKFVVSE